MAKVLQQYPIQFSTFLGAMLTFTLAPFYIMPLLFLSLSGLLYYIHHAPNIKQALLRAYGFGVGFNATALCWISVNFLFLPGPAHPPNYFIGVPVALLSLVLLAFGLGIFFIGFAYLSYHLPSKGLKGLTMQAAAWGVMFLVQGHVLSGFPWPPLAIAISFHPILMQPAALVGVYGVSFMVAWLGFIAYVWHQGLSLKQKYTICAIIMIIVSASAVRYIILQNTIAKEDRNIIIQMIQPSIKMHDKWNGDLFDQHVDLMVKMIQPLEGESYDIAILGETALPVLLEEDFSTRSRLISALPENAHLLIGTHTRARGKGNDAFYNSMIALNRHNEVVMKYHKRKLVPFGEYTPGRSIVNWFTPYQGGLETGEKISAYTLENISFTPNICYEGIFSGAVLPKDTFKISKKNKPDLMINISIDGWYGNTHGLRQNAAMQQYRAIEEGIPYARISDIGISFLADSSGKIIKKINYNNEQRVRVKVGLHATYTMNSFLIKIILIIIFVALIFTHWKSTKRFRKF